MKEHRKSLIPGILLILAGLALFFRESPFDFFNWIMLYPVLILIFAITLLYEVYRNKSRNALFWGITLLLVGMFFFMRNYRVIPFFDMDDSWSVFPLAMGLGFLALFIFNPDNWGVLIPGGFFLFVGITSGLRQFGFYLWDWDDAVESYWPVVFVLIGAVFFIHGLRRRKERIVDNDQDEPSGSAENK